VQKFSVQGRLEAKAEWQEVLVVERRWRGGACMKQVVDAIVARREKREERDVEDCKGREVYSRSEAVRWRVG
jgi:hypothetical protein